MPHPGLFWVIKRDQDRQPILQLERKLLESGEAGKTTLPHLKLSTALLLVAAQDFESAKKHYESLSGEDVAPDIRQQALVAARSLALMEGELSGALELEKNIGKLFPDSALLPPSLYSPQSVLGSGVTGSTWLARETPSGKQRVIKVNPPAQGDQSAFLQFCHTMLAQQMEHPSLERVLRIEPGGDGRMLRVSRYRPGASLEELVPTQGPLAEAEWLGIVWSLTEGLLSSHAKGLVHKAIRPGHVLLKPWGAAGTVNRWRVLLHGADQLPSRPLIHALQSQPDLARKTELGRSAARFSVSLPPEFLGKPRGPIWFGPIQDVFGMGLLTAYALTGTLHPSPLEWQAHAVHAGWRDLVEKASSWSQAPRLKHLLEFRDLLEKIAGPEIVGKLQAREREHAVLATEEAVSEDPSDLMALSDHAEALANANRHREAESIWNRCLDQSPKHVAALTGRSFCRLHLGRESEAEADLRLAAQAQPDQVEPTSLLARFLGGEQRPQEVLDITRDAVAKHPQDLTLRVERGKAFSALGQHQDALPEFQQAVRIQPGNPHLWSMVAQTQNHLDALVESLESWGKALAHPVLFSGEEHARFLLERAMVQEKLGRLNDALADTEKAVQLDPSPLTRMVRVRLLARAGKFRQGELEQRQLLTEMASAGTALPALAVLLLADLLQDLGQNLESKSLVDQVLAASESGESDAKNIFFSLPETTPRPSEVGGEGSQTPAGVTAQLSISEQDIPHARLRRAVERVRHWETTQNRSPDKRELKLVLEDLRAAQESKLPDSIAVRLQAHLAQGQLHSLLQKPKDAALSFSHAMNLDRFSLRAIVGRAQARLDMESGLLALEDAKNALALAPTNKQARLMWARVQHRLQNHDELVRALEEWRIQYPLDQDYQALLADALENKGRLEAAQRQWEDLLRLAPEHPFALEGKARLLARLKKPEAALEFLEGPGKSLASPTSGILRALSLAEHGGPEQLSQALATLDELAQQTTPEGPEQLLTRLVVVLRMGKKRETKAVLKALATASDQEWVTRLGEWLETMATGTPARSLLRLEKLLALKPGFLPWLNARVWHWISLEKWQEALAASAQLIQQTPEESWIVETRALTLACAPGDLGGNADHAVMLARQALDMAGDDSARHKLILAFCLAKKASKAAQAEAIQITRGVLATLGDQQPLIQAFAQEMLSHLTSRKPYTWKGPAWHRLVLV